MFKNTTTLASLTYLIVVASLLFVPTVEAQKTIDFEEFVEGNIVSTVDVDGFSVDVFGESSACTETTNAAVIFDSDCPGGVCSGDDYDLGSPNEAFAGPGVGTGGESGEFVNDTALGNLLIIHEVCSELTDPVADPDDLDGQSTISFSFEAPVDFCSYTIIDQEASESANVQFFGDDEMTVDLGAATTPNTGDNGVAVIPASSEGDGCVAGVKKIVFNRQGSRGLDNLVFIPPSDGCTYTIGGYKNLRKHADRWPDSIDPDDPFPFNPSQSYIEVLNTPTRGDAWYILAHQYIAANNNVLNGADETDIAGLLAEAEALLAVGPGNVPNGDRNDYTSLADTLDDYNNGVIGPGHCDDFEDEEEGGAAKSDLVGQHEDYLARESATPSGFDLHDAYPNPFNPVTTISFDVPESAHVRLSVFNMLGHEVKILVDGVIPAGHHQARFEAGELPSGGYIYRLETPSRVITRTMILLK